MKCWGSCTGRYYQADGEQYPASVRFVEENGSLGALFVDVDAERPLDSELAVQIGLMPDVMVNAYMSDSKYSPYWRMPKFGEDPSNIPDHAQFAVLKLADERFLVLVPVVGDEYQCFLQGDEEHDGGLKLNIACFSEGLTSCHTLALVYAVGDRPSVLTEQCVKYALKLLDNGTKHRTERSYPEIFEYLGWCSWDSMQIRVCEQGTLDKCRELREKDVPIKWAILDDMWAEIRNFYGKTYGSAYEMVKMMHASKMDDFEADPVRFPSGLASCIAKIKQFGLQVGMWYPVPGYWAGIEKDSKAYKKLEKWLIKGNGDAIVPDWRKEGAYHYFKSIHHFLHECGADFVKIDFQSCIYRFYQGMAPIGQIAREYHAGLEKATDEEFNSYMINCMGMSSEDIWNRSNSPIARCSDDFQPENREWFAKHILQCAYNSVFQGQFYWCDWDMWWTDDDQARKNSLMRAISGGPIYVSDKIGRTDPAVLVPLALSDGRILRCDRCATPTYDCMTTNPTKSGKALKIQNTAGAYGIVAALNIDSDGQPVSAVLCGEMIDGFHADEYAIYEHFSHEIHIMKWGDSIDIRLEDNDDYRLFIFAPIEKGFAAIGRTDKFISPKTIKKVEGQTITLIEDGPYAYVLNGQLFING